MEIIPVRNIYTQLLYDIVHFHYARLVYNSEVFVASSKPSFFLCTPFNLSGDSAMAHSSTVARADVTMVNAFRAKCAIAHRRNIVQTIVVVLHSNSIYVALVSVIPDRSTVSPYYYLRVTQSRLTSVTRCVSLVQCL